LSLHYKSPLTSEETKAMQELIHALENHVKPRLQELEAMGYLGEEEQAEYDGLLQALGEATEVLRPFANKLGNHLVNFSESLYFESRVKAANGHHEAQDFYDELKPSYDLMMQEKLNKQQN
jgi:hypothetical protein